MAVYKNTRPTVIQLPDGKNIMPGAEFEATTEMMSNPSMKIFVRAGFVKAVSTIPAAPPPPASPSPPNAPTPPKEEKPAAPPVSKKQAKLDAIKTADAEKVLKLFEGETDLDILAALEARASVLAPG